MDIDVPETSSPPHLLQQVLAAADQSHDRTSFALTQPLALVLHAAMLESGFLLGVEVCAFPLLGDVSVWLRCI